MKNTLLLLSVLLLWSCASDPKWEESSPSPSPLPQAIANPPAASTEGYFLQSLQESLSDMQSDLMLLLQSFHNDTLKDLLQSLERAKK